MWKKEGTPDQETTSRPETASSYVERSAPARPSAERAAIGRSITIHGEVSGDEDLLIQGRVDGSVNLEQHAVTIGPDAEVKAGITARVVMVDGRVEGNIKAEEQVVLRSSAQVEGDISAPRVVLEDGARFRGGVDMGEIGRRPRAAGGSEQARAPEARSQQSTSGEATKISPQPRQEDTSAAKDTARTPSISR